MMSELGSIWIRSCLQQLTLKRILIMLMPSVLLLVYLSVTDQATYNHNTNDLITSDLSSYLHNSFSNHDIDKRISFSTDDGNDILVFLHIQKTGGTFFGKNLVRNLRLGKPCICSKSDGMLKCPCMSSDNQRFWLFSRYSTGWKCGLHADYTELSDCLSSGKMDELEGFHRPRKYHYISVLREPLERYVSEWMHVARGASWIGSSLRCNGQSPSLSQLPHCYRGESWTNVTLEQFLSCPYNLARNRQTRMLANLTAIGCYSPDMMDNPEKKAQLLLSAKSNLRNMPFFGIIQYLGESQALFEWTFGLKFKQPMIEQKNRHNRFSGGMLYGLSDSMKQKIAAVNDLDIELFEYAKDLFLRRYQHMRRNT